MTGLRAILALGSAALVAALGTVVATPDRPAPPPPAPPAAADVQGVTTPASLGAGAGAPDPRGVPAGILQRAAEARALDRAPPAPACREEQPSEGAACAPRQTVEIQWDVARDR